MEKQLTERGKKMEKQTSFKNENGTCSICWKVLPAKNTKAAKVYEEPLYEVYEHCGKYFISDFVDRKVAHNADKPIRHLTVIIVAFVADGNEKGKWIVIDRTAKQWAKGKGKQCKSPSYNFFGGHVTADIDKANLLGVEVPQYILDESAKRELSEELLVLSDDNEILLEKWKNGKWTGERIGAKPYETLDLIPIGMSKFDGKTNLEFSYYYALATPEKDIQKLIASDDRKKGKHVALPILLKTEMELLKVPYVVESPHLEPQGEVCDAITRLWSGGENAKIYEKLVKTIDNYKHSHGAVEKMRKFMKNKLTQLKTIMRGRFHA